MLCESTISEIQDCQQWKWRIRFACLVASLSMIRTNMRAFCGKKAIFLIQSCPHQIMQPLCCKICSLVARSTAPFCQMTSGGAWPSGVALWWPALIRRREDSEGIWCNLQAKGLMALCLWILSFMTMLHFQSTYIWYITRKCIGPSMTCNGLLRTNDIQK